MESDLIRVTKLEKPQLTQHGKPFIQITNVLLNQLCPLIVVTKTECYCLMLSVATVCTVFGKSNPPFICNFSVAALARGGQKLTLSIICMGVVKRLIYFGLVICSPFWDILKKVKTCWKTGDFTPNPVQPNPLPIPFFCLFLYQTWKKAGSCAFFSFKNPGCLWEIPFT